jgi:serine/threonine-protein kinase RsbW
MSHPGSSAPSICQTISSRVAEADLLCEKVRTLLQHDDLSHLSFAVELLARECLNNAVIHGNRGDEKKSVLFRLWIEQQWIRLQVRDEGPGFAWRKPRPAENTTATSGRGLRLCELYAGRVRFNGCGNQITLWIKRDPTGKEGGNA